MVRWVRHAPSRFPATRPWAPTGTVGHVSTPDLRPADPSTSGASAPPSDLPPLRTVGWVNVRGGRLLAVRTTGKDRFFVPGGKVERGETDTEALVREIHEELGVRLDPATVRPAFVAEAPGHGLGGRVVRMHCLYAEPLPGSPSRRRTPRSPSSRGSRRPTRTASARGPHRPRKRLADVLTA